MKKTILALLCIVSAALVIFHDSFSVYFFQDDFFLLDISNVQSIDGLLRFFIPRGDVQFYRPLSHEGFYFIIQNLFGFQPFAFHLVAWIFWLIAVFIVFKISKFYLKSHRYRILVTGLYALSAIHYNSLFWISNFSYQASAVFYFSAIAVYLSGIGSRRKFALLISLFVIGLLMNEFLITLPLMIIADNYILKRKQKFQHTYFIIWSLIVISLYVILRFVLFKPNFGTYHFSFSPQVISSYRFFILFFLNWGETIKDQLITYWKIRTDFVQSNFLVVMIWILNALIWIFPVSLLIIQWWRRKMITDIASIFGGIWFLIALLPIIFVQSHISPHQGTIALFGFLILIVSSLENSGLQKKYRTIFFYCLITLWLVSSSMTVLLNNRIHWIYRRSELVKFWMKNYKTKPDQGGKKVIIIPSRDKDTIVALNDGKAYNVLFNDPTLKVIFQ